MRDCVGEQDWPTTSSRRKATCSWCRVQTAYEGWRHVQVGLMQQWDRGGCGVASRRIIRPYLERLTHRLEMPVNDCESVLSPLANAAAASLVSQSFTADAISPRSSIFGWQPCSSNTLAGLGRSNWKSGARAPGRRFFEPAQCMHTGGAPPLCKPGLRPVAFALSCSTWPIDHRFQSACQCVCRALG